MTIRINPQLALLSLAIIQPASPNEVAFFMANSVLRGESSIDEAELLRLFERWLADGLIIKVHVKDNLFSLSATGNHSLPRKVRHLRDKTRLFLLKDLRTGNLKALGESKSELADASSVSVNDLVLQEEQRPINRAAPPRFAQSPGPVYWPLLGKQLFVGSTVRSPSTHFRFGSFPNLKICHSAHKNGAEGNDFNLSDLSLCIGVSARLVSSFLFNPEKHYREFIIRKKNGNPRPIRAPRIMLKTVQYWILDHLLFKLRIHDACRSYRKGISIFDNAIVHNNKKYVANFDIKNYFPSIKTENLKTFFAENGFGVEASTLLAKLLTVNGELPQGAPTSPQISNSYLFGFDELMTKFSENRELAYSRYADDVTVSGPDYKTVSAAIEYARIELAKFNLFLNEDKTRIAGKGSRQVVTGLVVNEIVQPPRAYRHRVRAMFDKASKNPQQFLDRSKELSGHLFYLRSFKNIQNSAVILRYQAVLEKLTAPVSENLPRP